MSVAVKESSFANKRDIMKLTTRTDVTPLKDVAPNTIINVKGYVISEICNEQTGEVFDSITFVDKNTDEAFATRSTTFMSQFLDIWCDLQGDGEDIEIAIVKGKTKKNNDYITCKLV